MSKKSTVFSGMKKTFLRWQSYLKITEMGEIIRRYFVMNAFDGVLTSLGIIITQFALFFTGNALTSNELLITGFSTTIAIGISGLAGAYLAETAELRRSNIEIKEAMAVFIQEKNIFGKSKENTHKVDLKEEDYYPKVDLKGKKLNIINGEEIEHIEIDPVAKQTTLSRSEETKKLREKLDLRVGKRKKKEEKSLSEKAESFSSTIAAIIDGFSPALGAIFGFIPFFFGDPITAAPIVGIVIYSTSLFIEVAILFTLGLYLAKISEDKIWVYGLSMVATGVFTSLVSFGIVQIANIAAGG